MGWIGLLFNLEDPGGGVGPDPYLCGSAGRLWAGAAVGYGVE